MNLTRDYPAYVLLLMFVVLWMAEARMPLVRFAYRRYAHAIPNLVFATTTVLLNRLLSFLPLLAALYGQSFGFGLLDFGDQFRGAGIVATLCGIAALDGVAYLTHVGLHHAPWGWRIHRVHHADRFVDVSTALRQHPLETLVRVGTTSAGILIFGVSIETYAIYALLSALNAHLEHANIRTPPFIDATLGKLFVTPNFHKNHHSRHAQMTDSNYSNLFSFWDRLFGTATAIDATRSIDYGLAHFDLDSLHKIEPMLAMPFIDAPSHESRQLQSSE